MKYIPIARVAHVLPFVERLREIGVPVERELERFNLPITLLGQADSYVPALQVLRFLHDSALREGYKDLGVRGIAGMNLNQLSDSFKLQAQFALTPFAVLDVLFKLVHLENPLVRFWLNMKTDTVKVCSSIDLPSSATGREFSEWVQNIAVVAIIRECADPHWQPTIMAFRSPIHLGHLAPTLFPYTRFLVNQPCAWVAVPRHLLSRPIRTIQPGRSPFSSPQTVRPDSKESITSLPGSLKLLLKTYLSKGYPPIQWAAEMAGLSVRTLQRRLSEEEMNYSQLVQGARVELAMHLLKDQHVKVIDVAYELGYEDPSNFARAFRAFTGISPHEFRHQAFAQ